MGKRTVTFALAAAAFVFIRYNAASSNQPVESRITAVTVYQDRALITRTADVTLSPGIDILEFPNLPTDLLDQTLQVTGSANSSVKILDVRIKTVYKDTVSNARVQSILEKLSSLKGKEKILVKRIDVLRAETAFIDSLGIYYARRAGTQTSKTPYLDWEKVLTFIASHLDSVNIKTLATDSELKDVREKISRIEEEVRRMQVYPVKTGKLVAVTLSSPNTDRATLHISYLLPGASWSPLYKERVTSGSKTVDIVYSALVRQSTGEDWNNVALTLSTAQPAAGGTPPNLSTWRVGVYEPPPPREMSDNSLAKGQMQTIAAQAQLSKIAGPVADVVQAPTSATFVIAAPANIAADNTSHDVTITNATLPVKLSYTCIPALTNAAYLTAETKNTTDYPFLPGPADVFLDNSFVATSSIGEVSPGENFTSYLGIDKSVQVERKLINRFKESTGLFSKNTKITYTYQTTVHNTKKVPIDLLVKDRVPVSSDKRVSVEVLEPEPNVATPDDEGLIEWHLNLAPAEKKVLNLKFSVEAPSELQVSGLR